MGIFDESKGVRVSDTMFAKAKEAAHAYRRYMSSEAYMMEHKDGHAENLQAVAGWKNAVGALVQATYEANPLLTPENKQGLGKYTRSAQQDARMEIMAFLGNLMHTEGLKEGIDVSARAWTSLEFGRAENAI